MKAVSETGFSEEFPGFPGDTGKSRVLQAGTTFLLTRSGAPVSHPVALKELPSCKACSARARTGVRKVGSPWRLRATRETKLHRLGRAGIAASPIPNYGVDPALGIRA